VKRPFFDSQSYSETLSSFQRLADQPTLLAEQRKTGWSPKNALVRQSVCANNVFRLIRIQPKRSQLRNHEEALRRFAQLLRESLVVPKQRRPTKPSRAAKAQRLDSKRRDSQIKRKRQKVNPK
jgi:hypothetical protein